MFAVVLWCCLRGSWPCTRRFEQKGFMKDRFWIPLDESWDSWVRCGQLRAPGEASSPVASGSLLVVCRAVLVLCLCCAGAVS